MRSVCFCGVMRNKQQQQPATWSSKHRWCVSARHTIGAPSIGPLPLFLSQSWETAPRYSRKPIMHTALLLQYIHTCCRLVACWLLLMLLGSRREQSLRHRCRQLKYLGLSNIRRTLLLIIEWVNYIPDALLRNTKSITDQTKAEPITFITLNSDITKEGFTTKNCIDENHFW